MSKQEPLAEAIAGLEWLAEHGALAGIAQIIAERQAQIERHDPTPGEYAAESALDFGEWVSAAAIIAHQLDVWAARPPQ